MGAGTFMNLGNPDSALVWDGTKTRSKIVVPLGAPTEPADPPRIGASWGLGVEREISGIQGAPL